MGKGVANKKKTSSAKVFIFFSLHSKGPSTFIVQKSEKEQLSPVVLRVQFSGPRMPGTESPAPAAAAGTTTAAAAAAAAGPSNAANNGNAATAAAAAHARSASDEAMDAVAEARAVWPGAQTLVSVQELLDQNK